MVLLAIEKSVVLMSQNILIMDAADPILRRDFIAADEYLQVRRQIL
jgi:hypothetical protein